MTRCLDCNTEFDVLADTRHPIIRCPFCGSGVLDALPSPRTPVGEQQEGTELSDA